MDEPPVAVEDVAEKAEAYLHERSLTPEEYEALKGSVGELSPIFSAERAYFILGATARPRSIASSSSRAASTGSPARTRS